MSGSLRFIEITKQHATALIQNHYRVFLRRQDLDALIEASLVPAGRDGVA